MELTRVILSLTLTLAMMIEGARSLKPDPANQPKSEICLQKASQMDKCLTKLVIYGDREFDPPRTDLQLDEHCNSLTENLKCVSSYSRECLPSFAKNLYSVVIRRLKTQFAKRCKTKDGRTDFLNLMACADPKHMEPGHKCMDSFIAHLEHIGSGNQNRQIELTCCTFQIFQDCIFSASRKMQCSQRIISAEKSIEYVKTLINTMGGDMMEFMCGKYDSIQNCNNGYSKFMTQFKQISEGIFNGTHRAESSSPLKPMLQLFINQQAED